MSAITATSPVNPRKTAIVVGSGLAGLSAASQLLSHGISVHLLERAQKPGGNSIKASSGINGAPTSYQPAVDTAFYSDTVKSAGKTLFWTRTKAREDLISTLTGSSKGAIEWLVSEIGVDLSVVAQLGGHSVARTHRGKGKTPPGASIIIALLKILKENAEFKLETGCTVTKVLKTGNVIQGVEYVCEEGERVVMGPVVFASGGFAGDPNGMLAVYRPDLKGYPSTNEPRPGSQTLLTSVGAQLLDMEQVQVHPTSFVDPSDVSNPVKFLAAEMLRGEGGLLLDGQGTRFVDEMQTRKVVTSAITALEEAREEGPRQWDVRIVLDEGVYESARSHVDFYLWKGLMQKTTIADLGPRALESIKVFADAAAGRRGDSLGRQSFGHWSLSDPTAESVVYAGRVTPAVHFTMGGVVINEMAEVLGPGDERIEGLWAAGEVTGGVHGENRLGGSSLLECVVFGRIAGHEAAIFVGAGRKH
ncbi:FAD binding domain-containing protein [Rhexocercosporidium sp. MPI-PUGE-AT-0058]|nr:FAD binding domain-containing protein [Rhexocercosporidium sp. MPI-PUGE-AT-0058]